MQSLLARREPLRVKHGVDIARENFPHAIALLPRRAEPVGVLAAAEEARAMPGGQRRGLIEKEQFSPATTGHYVAPLAPELADASEPGPAAPASGEGFSRGIVDDAPMVKMPRCGVAMISPIGVTRFCSGIEDPPAVGRSSSN